MAGCAFLSDSQGAVAMNARVHRTATAAGRCILLSGRLAINDVVRDPDGGPQRGAEERATSMERVPGRADPPSDSSRVNGDWNAGLSAPAATGGAHRQMIPAPKVRTLDDRSDIDRAMLLALRQAVLAQ